MLITKAPCSAIRRRSICWSQPRERYTSSSHQREGDALASLNRSEESLANYRRGLELARESKNPVLIDFMEGNLAGGLVGRKRDEEAIPLLQSVLARNPTPYIASFRYGQLSEALNRTGRTAEALTAIAEAIRLDRELIECDAQLPQK